MQVIRGRWLSRMRTDRRGPRIVEARSRPAGDTVHCEQPSTPHRGRMFCSPQSISSPSSLSPAQSRIDPEPGVGEDCTSTPQVPGNPADSITRSLTLLRSSNRVCERSSERVDRASNLRTWCELANAYERDGTTRIGLHIPGMSTTLPLRTKSCCQFPGMVK